jgi:hypothetical protein
VWTDVSSAPGEEEPAVVQTGVVAVARPERSQAAAGTVDAPGEGTVGSRSAGPADADIRSLEGAFVAGGLAVENEMAPGPMTDGQDVSGDDPLRMQTGRRDSVGLGSAGSDNAGSGTVRSPDPDPAPAPAPDSSCRRCAGLTMSDSGRNYRE